MIIAKNPTPIISTLRAQAGAGAVDITVIAAGTRREAPTKFSDVAAVPDTVHINGINRSKYE
jgi:hypothetical protein